MELSKEDKRYPIMVITGHKSRMTADARHTDLFAKADYKVSRLAIIIPDFIPKILGNWYMKYVTQPRFEYKIFDAEDDAETWLLESLLFSRTSP
ncbi:MAG: hypothetical protein HRT71_15950 [Flavobacteriales bacterium]|nr:hypothetical protein [Flavobacteriales bacterium]